MSSETAGQGQGAPANTPPTNEPPEWYKNPPEWMTKPPQQQTEQSTSANSGQQRGYGQDILTALQALPEQLANSVKEMFPQQPSQQQPASNSDEGKQSEGTKETKDEKPTEPGKKTFSQWWFG